MFLSGISLILCRLALKNMRIIQKFLAFRAIPLQFLMKYYAAILTTCILVRGLVVGAGPRGKGRGSIMGGICASLLKLPIKGMSI
ncbi:hypothetical protein ES703_91889 [subsurface metagenome]